MASWAPFDVGSSPRNSQRFCVAFGFLNQRRAHTYYPTFIWRNRERVDLDGNSDGKRTQYTHDIFATFALEFIRQNQAKPFFLYVPFCIPHSRYEIPSTEPYSEMPWTENEKVHAAMVTRMDSDVGRMMALLEELEIGQNTLVFFCSDNGAANRWKLRFDSSGLLRGKKRDMYEGGIRTPMIAHWPGQIKAGTECDLPWYFADVLPTFADLVNVDAPAEIDGVSILPSFLARNKSSTIGFSIGSSLKAVFNKRCDGAIGRPAY